MSSTVDMGETGETGETASGCASADRERAIPRKGAVDTWMHDEGDGHGTDAH